jgi:hypothetical protein
MIEKCLKCARKVPEMFLNCSWIVSCISVLLYPPAFVSLCSSIGAYTFHGFSGLHVSFALRSQDLLESQDVLRFQVSILMIYPEMWLVLRSDYVLRLLQQWDLLSFFSCLVITAPSGEKKVNCFCGPSLLLDRARQASRLSRPRQLINRSHMSGRPQKSYLW